MILRVTPFPSMRGTGLEMTIDGAVIRRTISWEMLDSEFLHHTVDSMESMLRRFLAHDPSN